MAEFDRLTACVDDDAGPANASIFEEVEPWPEPVDGADLLDDVTHALARHVIADKETLRAAALWAAFTWLVDVVQVAPIANITAPEKRCGKSILLTALGKLANRPLQVSNIAPAALYRSIELWAPTLLIDEVDAFLAAHEDARGILNAGFTRDSAIVIRCVGDDHMPTAFNVWAPRRCAVSARSPTPWPTAACHCVCGDVPLVKTWRACATPTPPCGSRCVRAWPASRSIAPRPSARQGRPPSLA